MLRGISYNEDNIQQGEPSTATEELSNLNRGKKRKLESENTDNNVVTGTSNKYPSIEAKMINLTNKDFLSLSFDASILSTEGEKYLEEICIVGRTVLFEHYSVRGHIQARNIVDHITMRDISIPENS